MSLAQDLDLLDADVIGAADLPPQRLAVLGVGAAVLGALGAALFPAHRVPAALIGAALGAPLSAWAHAALTEDARPVEPSTVLPGPDEVRVLPAPYPTVVLPGRDAPVVLPDRGRR